jgi:hypothetical protein
MMLLGLGPFAQAQQYFNIRNCFHSSTAVLTSVLERNGKYYVTGVCVDSSNYALPPDSALPVGIKFAVFGSYGNKLLDTFYQKSSHETLEAWNAANLYSLNDGNLIMAAQYMDVDTCKALIVKFDSLGHRLYEHVYVQPFCTDNNWYKILDFKPTGTGEWLLLGDVYCTINANLSQNVMGLTKLDSNFNIIWSKRYGSTQDNHGPTKVFIDTNGYILAGGVNDYNQVANGSYFQPELIRVDTAGTVQWTWIRNQGPYYYGSANDVIRTKDGGFVYCGQGLGYHFATYVEYKGWIEKLDANRTIVWNKAVSATYSSTDYNELNVVKELPDSSLVFAGGVTSGYDPVDSTNDYIYGGLMHLKNDGTIIWQRKYRVAISPLEYYLYDMKPTGDGGYIMVGQANDLYNHYAPPHQQAWIIKVDSNGCVSPTACDATDAQKITANGNTIKVYPNPAKDLLQIDYYNIASGEMQILDITGRTIIKHKLGRSLDISQLASGIYIYKISVQGIVKGQGKIVKE